MSLIAFEQNKRLEKQINFIIEIDKVKNVIRKSLLFDGSRFENVAEHSWTVSIMAILLKEYANFKVDIGKVLFMLLIHDIVEVDAGDTFLYSDERKNAHFNEQRAAERIFGILDPDQKKIFIDTWKEYEEGKTNEAKFALVFDRLQPITQNYVCKGITWKKHNVTYEQVVEENKCIKEGSEEIWSFVEYILQKSVEKGYLAKNQPPREGGK
ncbi:MAG TPA: HD domain-containing protein [Candidatus Atribacteria bacterium]|nr:HD domain-containing protein [Candidatus Atribacteria bacterium]